MISKDKTYRTRDGREVRIYATDGHPLEPIHGALQDYTGQWNSTMWQADGSNVYGGRDADLIEVKPRIRRTVWLNLYKYHTQVIGYAKKEDADADRVLGDRACCVKVEINCEHGEGL